MKIVDLIRAKTQKMGLENFFAEGVEVKVRECASSLSERFSPTRINETSNTSSENAIERASAVLPAAQIYYEQLLQKIGHEVHEGLWYDITQDAIQTFGRITQDNQWIHLDVERARRESPFRSTVAQGFLVISMIPVLRDYANLIAVAPYPVRMVVNCGIDQVRFLHPVKPGTKIRARAVLQGVELMRKYVEVTETIAIEMETGLKNVCTADMTYRIYL